eukprot:894113-Pelagomonas_calceolata.AAC.8
MSAHIICRVHFMFAGPRAAACEPHAMDICMIRNKCHSCMVFAGPHAAACAHDVCRDIEGASGQQPPTWPGTPAVRNRPQQRPAHGGGAVWRHQGPAPAIQP